MAEEEYEGGNSCQFCHGDGWYNEDGWPVHCIFCGADCGHDCPVCEAIVEDMEIEDTELDYWNWPVRPSPLDELDPLGR